MSTNQKQEQLAKRFKNLQKALANFAHSNFTDPEHGGAHERIDQEGNALDQKLGFKRLLVQCRMLFLFSRCSLTSESHSKKFLKNAGGLFDFIEEHFFDSANGGYIFSIEPTTKVALNSDKDFYAQAFVVFAYSAFLNSLIKLGVQSPKQAQIRCKIAEQIDWVESNLKHTSGLGYFERLPVHEEDMRRQNPHMHWLEALLQAYEACNNQEYIRLAAAQIQLFSDKFYDHQNHCVIEFFNEELSPHKSKGHITEGGHSFEWAWLIDWFIKLSSQPTQQALRKIQNDLFTKAWKHSWDQAHGGFFDQVDPRGLAISKDKRIWPLTECIKATAVSKPQDNSTKERLTSACQHLVENYLADNGSWKEHLNQDGEQIIHYLPGSTVYHLILALEYGENSLRLE